MPGYPPIDAKMPNGPPKVPTGPGYKDLKMPSGPGYQTTDAKMSTGPGYQDSKMPSGSGYQTTDAKISTGPGYQQPAAKMPSESGYPTTNAKMPTGPGYQLTDSKMSTRPGYQDSKLPLGTRLPMDAMKGVQSVHNQTGKGFLIGLFKKFIYLECNVARCLSVYLSFCPSVCLSVRPLRSLVVLGYPPPPICKKNILN